MKRMCLSQANADLAEAAEKLEAIRKKLAVCLLRSSHLYMSYILYFFVFSPLFYFIFFAFVHIFKLQTSIFTVEQEHSFLVCFLPKWQALTFYPIIHFTTTSPAAISLRILFYYLVELPVDLTEHILDKS